MSPESNPAGPWKRLTLRSSKHQPSRPALRADHPLHLCAHALPWCVLWRVVGPPAVKLPRAAARGERRRRRTQPWRPLAHPTSCVFVLFFLLAGARTTRSALHTLPLRGPAPSARTSPAARARFCADGSPHCRADAAGDDDARRRDPQHQPLPLMAQIPVC